MSRCRLSDRKVKRKVRPLVPAEFTVAGAMARGGWPHGIIMACLIVDGKRRTGTVDTQEGTFELDGLDWQFTDESKLEESIAFINASSHP